MNKQIYKQYDLRCINKSKSTAISNPFRIGLQCKIRENKKGTILITLHRKLQSKLRYLHSKLDYCESLQKPFRYHFLTREKPVALLGTEQLPLAVRLLQNAIRRQRFLY